MTARATDPLWADEQHDRADSWASVPEPPELTAWAEQRAKAKAAEEAAAKTLCASCNKRRDDADHRMSAARLDIVRCRFVEASR